MSKLLKIKLVIKSVHLFLKFTFVTFLDTVTSNECKIGSSEKLSKEMQNLVFFQILFYFNFRLNLQ